MTKIPWEKTVAGLSCSDVLTRLSDYLDAELAPEERVQVEAHLRGCEGCARFGGELGATVRALRTQLDSDERLPEGFRSRLQRALDSDDE